MTSNDALAKRDANDNRKVFDLLGISCGFVPSRRSVKKATAQEREIYNHLKRLAYMCDVVYAMPSTIAFDYLSDNTVYDPLDKFITKGFSYAIVDEADDVLIDQAINPLRLSGSSKDSGEYALYLLERARKRREAYKWATEFLYGKPGVRMKPLVGKIYDREPLTKKTETADYVFIKNTKEVIISDENIIDQIGRGVDEDTFNLRYVALHDCIKAKEGFTNGVEYNVDIHPKSHLAEVVLIDQNIGRKKYQNKYTNGMQEAIEAKEQYLEQDSINAQKRYNIEFTKTIITKAVCTYPDFLGLYEHGVCGMTGTSDEEEFKTLYGFQTYNVKTRKRNIRIDEEDELYATMKEKLDAIIEKVVSLTKAGIPVLIGTTSLNESRVISSMLANKCIRHKVLNANNEEEENAIVANAGLYGSVTVATNMAGRGTDIKLGPGVRELGGLYVIGTSKNKSRRIDLQLRGRSGRQGDPGKSKYYSSLEDDLVKEYSRSGEITGIVELLKGTHKPITNKKVIRLANKSQYLRECKDKESRIITEKYHKAFTEHRKIVYKLRNKILNATPLEFTHFVKNIMAYYISYMVDNADFSLIKATMGHMANVEDCYSKDHHTFKNELLKDTHSRFRANFKEKGNTTEDVLKYIDAVKANILSVIDIYWVEHINYLESLKSTVSVSIVNDPFADFQNRANETFAHKLIPAMYNEIITYAINPKLKFGDYQMKYPEIEEEQAKL